MKKAKYIMIVFFIGLLLFLIPNISNAAVNATREVSNNGSAKFHFTGLELDKTHEYEFGVTKTQAEQVANWHSIVGDVETAINIELNVNTEEFKQIIITVDKAYITIKDKTADAVILQPYAVDLTIPYLSLTNYKVLNNGKNLRGAEISISVPTYTTGKGCLAYYQYEKITDEKVIDKYKEIKSKAGNYDDLQPLLKTKVNISNWQKWHDWADYGNWSTGFTESPINAPDKGLYYMWVRFSGENKKDIYGYILVDNLQPEVALEGISLSKTEKVELGKTITLNPIFNPAGATNKIVTWASSDESVATVDNAGKVTPKKLGSTVITATSQDGNKKATCTVTVTEATSNNGTITPSNNNGSSKGDSTTLKTTKLPQTGESIAVIVTLVVLTSVGIVLFIRYRKYKDIK